MTPRQILVLAGVGNSSGTGGATARLFSKAGYRVALIARRSDNLTKFSDGLNASGGEAATFPVQTYSYQDIRTSFAAVRARWPDSAVRVALYNVGYPLFKPFIQVTEDDLQKIVDTNVMAAFSFAREAILSFQGQELDERGKRGTLLFTGATASLRGGPMTSAFSAGKFALRALAQSLNKEFGKENIHVANAIVDGNILSDVTRVFHESKWAANPDVRLDPEEIAKSYLYLVNQHRSAWTHELDLRPAHEKW
ncbi:NAD-P-binding protein [Amylostereum chailletii]|nr:NAD-P-binding protein [Amylostereum chailletii]